jgi:phosphomannomutase
MFLRIPQSADLLKAYESDSGEIKDEVHREGEDIIKSEKLNKKKEWGKPKDIRYAIKKVLENYPDCFTERVNTRYLDMYKIANLCGVGTETAKKIMREVEKIKSQTNLN